MTNCRTVGSPRNSQLPIANGRWPMEEESACNERLEAPPPLRLSSGVLTRPKVLLRIEAGLDLVLSLIFYQYLHANWILFVVLLLAPDLAILGYIGGTRIGTICYNLIHTFAGPFLLIGYSCLTGSMWLLPYALIWTSHIGLDRMLGFGLKYPTEFRDTHLKNSQ